MTFPRAASPVGVEACAATGDAAKTLAAEPLTLQLRYLQTLTEIGVEKNTTIVFPLPVDILSALTEALKRMGGGSAGK